MKGLLSWGAVPSFLWCHCLHIVFRSVMLQCTDQIPAAHTKSQVPCLIDKYASCHCWISCSDAIPDGQHDSLRTGLLELGTGSSLVSHGPFFSYHA